MIEYQHRLNGHESKQTLGDGEGQRSSPWGCKELDTTQSLNGKQQQAQKNIDLAAQIRMKDELEIEKQSACVIQLQVKHVGASQEALVVKDLPANAGDIMKHQFDPCIGKILWRRAWQSTTVCLLGESHGQRSQAGCRSQGCKELDMTKATLHTHTQSMQTLMPK